MEIIGNIDFEKYHTFFLEYFKGSDHYRQHLVRPSTATYEEIISKKFCYTIEGAILTFEKNETIPKILTECALFGISIDFIEIKVNDDSKETRWYSDTKTFQIIDTHKEDVTSYFDSINAPRYYCALNTKKTDILKFLVIDRFNQDSKIEFLKGQYDKKSVIAGFKEQKAAYEMCRKLNNFQLHDH